MPNTRPPTDLNGNAVAVGDRIAYATLSTRTVKLRTGVVLAVTDAEELTRQVAVYKRTEDGSRYVYPTVIERHDEVPYWTRASVTVKPEQKNAKTVETHEFVKLAPAPKLERDPIMRAIDLG